MELQGSPDDWDYVDGPAARLRRPRAAHPARQGARRLELPERDDLHPRPPRSTTTTGPTSGNPGWGYEDVLPLFKRSEDFDRGESEYHGAGGLLHVIADYEPHPFHAAVVEAAQEVGHPVQPRPQRREQDGVGFCAADGQGRQRASSQTVAFLRPVLDAPNLTVLTQDARPPAAVRRRSLRRRRDRRDGAIEQVRATHEVVVSRRDDRVAEAADALRDRGRRTQLRAPGSTSPSTCPASARTSTTTRSSPLDLRVGAADAAGRRRACSRCTPTSSRTASPGLRAPDIQPLFFHVPLYFPGMSGPDGRVHADVGRPDPPGQPRRP